MTDTILIACPQCKAQLRGPVAMAGKKVRCKACGHVFVVQLAGPAAHKPPAPKSASPKANGSPMPGPKAAVGKKTSPAAPPTKASAPKESTKPQPASEEKKSGADSMYGLVNDEEAMKKLQEFRSKNPTGGDPHITNPGAEKKQDPYGLTDVSLLPRCPHCAHEMPDEEAIICLNCGYNTHTRTHVETKRVAEITPKDVFQYRLPAYVAAVVALCGFIFICFVWLGVSHVVGDDDKHSLYFMTKTWFRMYGSLAIGALTYFAATIAYRRLVLHPDPPEQKL